MNLRIEEGPKTGAAAETRDLAELVESADLDLEEGSGFSLYDLVEAGVDLAKAAVEKDRPIQVCWPEDGAVAVFFIGHDHEVEARILALAPKQHKPPALRDTPGLWVWISEDLVEGATLARGRTKDEAMAVLRAARKETIEEEQESRGRLVEVQEEVEQG